MATVGVYALVVVLGVIIVVTIIGCLLTIVAIWIRPDLRKLANVPLVSLSCADILFAIFGPAFWIGHFLHPEWKPPGALCSFLAYAIPALWGVWLCHMSSIALQRYFLICTKSTRLKSKRVLIIMLLLTWLCPIVSLLPLHVPEEVKVDPKIKRCSIGGSANVIAKLLIVIMIYAIPYVVSITCYVLIYKHVGKSGKRVRSHALRQSKRLAVRFTRGEGGSAPSSQRTASAWVTLTRSSGTLDGGVWMGDDNSSSSNEEGKRADEKGPIGTNRRKIVIVSDDQVDANGNQEHVGQNPSDEKDDRDDIGETKAATTDTAPSDQAGGTCNYKQQDRKTWSQDQNPSSQDRNTLSQDQNTSSDDNEQEKNVCKEPDTAVVIDMSIDSGTNEQKHRVGQKKSSQNSAAERQITKMMLTLFLVNTVCVMPMTLMVMFASKVPSEAFAVGQVLMALNGALDPFVYGLMNTRIRQGYKHILDRVLDVIN